MVKITFIEDNGNEHVVEGTPGLSLMQSAIRNDVPGIDAECGGACACATCHVYIDEAWQAATGAPEIMEQSMLEFALHLQPNSRLSCQIKVDDKLDGLVVRIPVSQS